MPRATAILRDTTFRLKSVHVSNEIRTFHACHWPLKSSLSLLNSEYLSHRCLPIPVNCNEFHCLMLYVCVIARVAERNVYIALLLAAWCNIIEGIFSNVLMGYVTIKTPVMALSALLVSFIRCFTAHVHRILTFVASLRDANFLILPFWLNIFLLLPVMTVESLCKSLYISYNDVQSCLV